MQNIIVNRNNLSQEVNKLQYEINKFKRKKNFDDKLNKESYSEVYNI